MTEREALQNLVKAWEALPLGFYGARTVQRWMDDDIKPAIDQARKVLGRAKPRTGEMGNLDIVIWLRQFADRVRNTESQADFINDTAISPYLRKAADEIEQLRAAFMK
jgi:hypothetical protein